jgi:hypothetical protein
MTKPDTLEACAADGLNITEAARLCGIPRSRAVAYAKKHGLTFIIVSARERMKALHADPEFAERHRELSRERMKALNADPEFAERHRELSRERMKALNADPDYNPLVLLSDAERQDYNLLRHKGGLPRNDALRAIGRGDLVRGAE